MTVIEFLTAAVGELNVTQAGEALAGEDADLALLVFNEILDRWNAEQRAPFTVSFPTFTLTPNLQPHTIGLAANLPTWTIPAPTDGGSGTAGMRPQAVLGANLILTGSPASYVPITVRDKTWWNSRRVPGLTSGIPTDLYYAPDWPNGSIYFWPVPITAYGVQLEIASVLAQMTFADTLTLPPGYQQALRLTTTEGCATAFGVQAPPTLSLRAMEARAIVFGNNDDIPRLVTSTAGLRGGGGSRSNFDYRTGGFTG